MANKGSCTLNASNGLAMPSSTPASICDPAKDVPVPHLDEELLVDTFDYHSQFGLCDQSDAAFEVTFGFSLNFLSQYIHCPPHSGTHSWSYAHNMFAQVQHPKHKFCWALLSSLPQLSAVCNINTFDELHWYAYYVQQALIDLAALWPKTNSPVPALLAGVLLSDYMLDGETYNPTYKSDIDTDNLEAWSSAYESDAETKPYLFNNHLGYSEDDLSDLARIKQEPVANSILLHTPLACSPSPNATPAKPSPLQTLTFLPTPLRKGLNSQIPFSHDTALVSGGAHLLLMRLSEGMIPPSVGLDTMVMDYFEHPEAYGSRSRTATKKGKAKAKPTSSKVTSSIEVSCNTKEEKVARKERVKLMTPFQSLKPLAKEFQLFNSTYQGFSNVNTLSVCLKHHLKCSNSLLVEELKLMFQQLLLPFSGLMPALMDNFSLLKSFLSKATWEQAEAATSIKIVHQILNCLCIAALDPQHFLYAIWLWNGHRELEPAIGDDTWACFCSLMNYTWTNFEEAQKHQHDILHHPDPFVNFTPMPFDTSAVPPSNLSFTSSRHSRAISAAQVWMYMKAINHALLEMQIKASFIKKSLSEED
uniref:Uncharacterized protein n=1 Tax=Moniliophthora roreri TaxID=221103 RepID=A0A0W0F656_MONRR